MPEDTILSRQTSVNLVPFIGQRFVSQDAAYEFYCSFAKQCGFSIRRHRTRGKDGVGRGITRRDFTCHRGGYPQLKPTADGKLQRNRKSSRCGCQAYMRIVKRADFDVPEWRVTGFSNVHNHELLKSNEVQLLPAYCTMTADDKSRIFIQKCGPGHNDPIDLLKMCKEKKDTDPNFKYNYKLDSNNRLEHIAWSYASSIRLYDAFGDVVVFDTTHRLDAYDMLLGIWIGVDNHGTYCFFGCLLLRDENVQSFSWGLKTFLAFMSGKAPGTILTDQNTWLKEAISTEMPGTKHAFSIWHIISKFSDWFSVILGPQYDNWKAEFHRLYNLHTVASVLDARDQAGAKLKMLHKVPRASLKTGSPIESHAATVLTPYAFCKLQEELVLAPQYATMLVDESYFIVRHHTEVDGGCKVLWVPQDEFITCSCRHFEFSGILCRHVLRVLSTNNCFHIPDQYIPLRWRDSLFTKCGRTSSGKVQLLQSMISSLITESIETEDRLDVACDHIALVLARIKEFPVTADGSNDIAYNSPSGSLILPDVEDSHSIGQSFSGNAHECLVFAKLKDSRSRDELDMYRKRRRCPVPCCGQFGHDASNCPMVRDDDLNGDGLGFL
ncbi:UNVERIFIED_CONTAM: protein FAR1-RELATED SEQUENCE 11 [Sesamum radiatum]|uniref:Protein FAR1-RELATED SEQUENCE n=1 Tax=Sesamum radiatum TaxID=300843 RepID=A0AAW2W746_SESRA